MPTETDLAAMLGVSRGPLREGVSALVAMGVLDTRQGDGTYVTSLEPSLLMAPLSFAVDMHSKDGARQFLAVRRVLECEAAGLAALRIVPACREADATSMKPNGPWPKTPPTMNVSSSPTALPRHIAAASRNPMLAALIESISGRTARARVLRGIVEEGAQQRTIDEHRAVLAAVVAHDPDRARLRMAVHLVGVEDFLQVAPTQEL